MLSLRRLISSALTGAALLVAIIFSEATLEVPELYGDGFCLLEQGSRVCAFPALALCMKKMQSAEAECVRELSKEESASIKSRNVSQ